MSTSRKSKLAAAAAAGTMLLGGGGAAFASTSTASTPAGGTIHVFVNGNVKSQTVDPIFITGAIGDYGTTTSTNKAGKADPNGDFGRVVLKKGSFVVGTTKLNAANHSKPTLNPTTCSFLLAVSGPTTVSAGTGLYRNISGTVTFKEIVAGVLPRHANGSCNVANNAEPLSLFVSAMGSGKVNF